MWELAPDHYQSVLGIEEGDAGLQSLASRLIDGRPLKSGETAVLVDSDYAAKRNVHVGTMLDVGDIKFPVVGSVDAARGGKVVRADAGVAHQGPPAPPRYC